MSRRRTRARAGRYLRTNYDRLRDYWNSRRDIKHVVEDLKPIQERRREIDARPSLVADVLEDGNRRARAVAGETMKEVREAVGLA